ncbi:MAG: hypothetical protein N3D10_01635 [Candidatus Micrarchaeota archaeon]|nr:hypothetical protein [Candidatus Micrarchaeota archaeon]
MLKTNSIFLFFLILIFSLFLGGCVQVEEKDRLNETHFFDYTSLRYNKDFGSNPCTIFLCTKENPDLFTRFTNFIKKILNLKVVENDIAYSKCDFYFSNANEYKKILDNFNMEKGWWAKCQIDKQPNFPCSPRFFMIGQGSNAGEFSLAQRYCDGQLNMPVFWITPDKNGKLKAPHISWLACENSKSRIPVLVVRTLDFSPDGRLIDSKEFVNFLQSLRDKNKEFDNYFGPIIVTTEALAKPYYFDSQTKRKVLNITLLEKIANQIELINKNCQTCLVALALDPTFNENGLPDLCPIDYFVEPKFNFSFFSSQFSADPLNCSSYYPTQSLKEYLSRAAKTRSLKIDLVGVGLFANNYNYSNLSSFCSPSYVASLYLTYSWDVIKYFEIPGLWYAIAFSEGPTVQPDCEFTKEDVALAYENLIKGVEGFRSKGIIGIAPYTFLNDYQSLPIPCISQKQVFKATALDLKKLKNGDQISSLDNKEKILINRIFYNSGKEVFFEAQNGYYYLAYQQGNMVFVNKTGCQFGFKNLDNTLHNNASTFFWFSNCQYYFSNKGTLFYTSTSPDQLQEGKTINSVSNPNSIVYVEKITSKDSSSVVFYDTLGATYLLAKDGKLNKLYFTTPNFSMYSRTPLIFPRNGMFNPSCLLFSSGGGEKLYAKKSFLASDLGHALNTVLEEPYDPKLQKNISLMQCGLCFFSSPMPEEFCFVGPKVSFPEYACVQYPQMDVAFLMNEVDPIFMRAIAIGESGLGRRIDKGASAPACQIGKGNNYNNCNAAQKQLSNLQQKENEYCSASDIAANYPSDPSLYACGLGVMQCIDFPSSYSECGGSAYNPFNPYDSACCGAIKFSTYYSKYAKPFIQKLVEKNQLIKEQIEQKKDWYAALLASYIYFRGPGHLNELEKYLLAYSQEQLNTGINFVKYFLDFYQKLKGDPDYGIKVIKRYNAGLKTCANGCPYFDCDYYSLLPDTKP